MLYWFPHFCYFESLLFSTSVIWNFVSRAWNRCFFEQYSPNMFKDKLLMARVYSFHWTTLSFSIFPYEVYILIFNKKSRINQTTAVKAMLGNLVRNLCNCALGNPGRQSGECFLGTPCKRISENYLVTYDLVKSKNDLS